MFTEPNNFVKVLKELVKQEIGRRVNNISVWEVTDIKSKQSDGYITDYRANIKQLNFKHTLDDVPIVGVGLGHKKGMLKYPNVGDYVLVVFDNEQPYIIGTVFDFFSQNKDKIPQIKLDEFIIVNKEDGAIFLIKENNEVIILSADSNGNFTSRLKLSSDGSFKLLNKNGFGIYVNSNGDMTLAGNTINMTQTPISW